MRGQSILVTGASGFIGGHLCRRLLELGATVHGVTRQANRDPIERLLTHALDLSDAAAVDRLIHQVQPHYVFHLASHVSGARELAEVRPTLQSNLVGTVNLLHAITGMACRRIVCAGSLEEGPDTLATPSSPYAAAKMAASMYARMFFTLYGTPVTIARLFMVYGPGQRDTRKLVPYVATSLLAGHPPKLTSGVRPVDWVYVDDVVDALIACATTPDLEGRTIDIGTGQMTTIRSVAERIAQIVGRGQPVFDAVDDRRFEQVRAADPEPAQQMLGRPLTPLPEGLKRTIDWYREHAASAETIASSDDA